MKFNLKPVLMLALVCSVGCKTVNSPEVSSNGDAHGVNGVGLFLPYYVGVFGDNQPTWKGQWYKKGNLSVVAHLPTKSEFFVYVCGPADEGIDVTNNIRLIAEKIRDKSGAAAMTEQWSKVTQKINFKKEDDRLVDVNYLVCEFDGHRVDTDWYSKADRVTCVIYVACLTPDRNPSKSIYSVSIAMIPEEVSDTEKNRLLAVLNEFLHSKITYLL
jgi:hypothetical protein